MNHLILGGTGTVGSAVVARLLFRDFDAMFLLIGNTITELHEGLAALVEARRAGVKRIVYLSAFEVERGPHLPHFAAKVAIEQAIRATGVPFTILRPNSFYQADYFFKDAILDYGVYPQPIGNVGISRVDVRDIADAAATALTEPGHQGRTYNLVGPEPLTGADCARGVQRGARAGGSLSRQRPACIRRTRPKIPSWLA